MTDIWREGALTDPVPPASPFPSPPQHPPAQQTHPPPRRLGWLRRQHPMGDAFPEDGGRGTFRIQLHGVGIASDGGE